MADGGKSTPAALALADTKLGWDETMQPSRERTAAISLGRGGQTAAYVAFAFLLAVLVALFSHYAITIATGKTRRPASTLLEISRTISIGFVFVGFVYFALFLAYRRGRDAMALLFSAHLLGFALLPIGMGVLELGTNPGAWNLLAIASWPISICLVSTVALMYPSGRLVPRWGVFQPPLAGLVAFLVAFDADQSGRVPMLGIALLFAVASISLWFLVHRYRRHASPEERGQLKWYAYGVVMIIVLQMVAVIVHVVAEASSLQLLGSLIEELLILTSFIALLLCLSFSELRYRLWDIDVVFNRTLVGMVVTVVLGLFFVLFFLVLQALLRTLHFDETIWGALASTGCIVALFAPTRRSVRRYIDRHLYGISLDYRALGQSQPDWVHPQTKRFFVSARKKLTELERIGGGGMGEVYRARDESGRQVAVKTLSPVAALNPDSVARFVREANILEHLSHPNIAQIYELVEEDPPFFVMEYINGEDLSSRLEARARFSVDEVVSILHDVALALNAAHEAGVVHRDVKPSNIMLAASRVVLMDFGVARWQDNPQLTESGNLIGTLHYIAPEQIKDASQVDGRADIYALGATAYHLLCGRPPFVDRSSLGLVLAHLKRPPPPPTAFAPELPQHVSHALLLALQKEPAERFPSASAFVSALRSA